MLCPRCQQPVLLRGKAQTGYCRRCAASFNGTRSTKKAYGVMMGKHGRATAIWNLRTKALLKRLEGP